MSEFLHQRILLNRGAVAVLECDTQCNFMLLDDQNFNDYRDGRSFEYFGQYFEYFPAQIVAPHSGYWNVVIDLGGARANIKYNISYR
jgi:hypothetical protein